MGKDADFTRLQLLEIVKTLVNKEVQPCSEAYQNAFTGLLEGTVVGAKDHCFSNAYRHYLDEICYIIDDHIFTRLHPKY